MALLRKFFHKKPPDGLVEMAERVYVFDSCFKMDPVEDRNYNTYISGIVSQLRANSPDSSYMVLNFLEAQNQSQLAKILCKYDMIVVNYPCSYGGYPLLALKKIHHFLRSCENWLSLGQQNVLLLHCDQGGWLLLAFMIATLLIYRKQCTGEQRTLDMIHKLGPRKFLHLMSPLNSCPSQLRYLHYISSRDRDMEWPPLDKVLLLDFIVLRLVPDKDGLGNCYRIVRIYGQDPLLPLSQNPKVLFSTSERSRTVQHDKQGDSEVVKIDVHCCVCCDIVFECINLDEDREHEETIFSVMLKTAFVRSNILMLNRDEVDTVWNAINLFPKDFRVEVHISEIDLLAQTCTSSSPAVKKRETPVDTFAKVQEIFGNVKSHESSAEEWPIMLQKKTAEITSNENLEITSGLVDSGFHDTSASTQPEAKQNLERQSTSSSQLTENSASRSLEKQPKSYLGPFIDMNLVKATAHCGHLLPALHQSCHSKIISPRLSQSFRCGTSVYSNALQGSRRPISRYQSATSPLGISAVLHDHVPGIRKEVTHIVASSPSSLSSKGECAGDVCKLEKPTFTSVSPPPPPPPPLAEFSLQSMEVSGITRTSAALPPPLAGLSQQAEVPVAMRTYVTPPQAPSPPALVQSLLQSEEVPVVIRTSLAHPLPSHTPSSPPAHSSLEHVQFSPIIRASAAPFPAPRPPRPPPLLLPLHTPPACSNQSSSVSFMSHVIPSAPKPPPPLLLPSPPKYYNQPTSESFLSLVGPTSPQMQLLLQPPPPPPPPPLLPPKCCSQLTSDIFLSLAAPPPPLPSPPEMYSDQSISKSFLSPVGPRSPQMTTQPPPPPPLHASSIQSTSETCLSPRNCQNGDLLTSRNSPSPSPPPPPPPPPSRAYLPLTTANTFSTPSPPSSTLARYALSTTAKDSLLSSSKQCIEAKCAPKCSGFITSPIGSSLVPQQTPPSRAALKGTVLKTAPEGPSIPFPPTPPIQGLSKAPHSSQQSQLVKSNGSVLLATRLPLIVNERPSLCLPLKNQGQLKRTSLKPYHWMKLTRVMQGSLWAETQKSEDASKTPEFDISELENLFAACTLDPKHGSTGGKSNICASGPKLQLIELRRAYNCEIMLSKVKIPLPDLTSSVLALDDSALDVDQVENLIKFCPTQEEMELLKGYKGDRENLGKCEQFFLEMMKVPRVEAKLRVFYFKTQFGSQVSDLRNNLNTVNSASEEIRSSVKLKRIMQAILMLGNVLNQGTARGSAVGFRLDSLLKLTDTRAQNSKMTLMHYLCKVLAEKLPELLDFPKDLASLEASTKIQLKFLAEEMQAISKGLEKVVQELHASESDGLVSENFSMILKEFLVYAKGEARALDSFYSIAGRNADALAMYFGEDPARCPFEQVVSTLLNFVRLFVRAHQENCKQLEFEKKDTEGKQKMRNG